MTKRFLIACALLACSEAGPTARSAAAPPEVAPLEPAEKRLELEQGSLRDAGQPALLLSTLREELDRSVTELKRRAPEPPYFVAYQAIDEHTVSVTASLGALVESDDERWRSVDVDVRVGSPELDNRHSLRGEWDATRHYGRSAWLPREDDASAIRAVLWLSTHQEHQRAVEELVRVRVNKGVKVVEEDQSHDFSPAPPVTYHAAPAALNVDRASWERRLKSYSAIFREHPEIHESEVAFQAVAETRYFVSTEPSALQIPRTHVRVTISAATTANDGMRLDRTELIDATTVERLPSEAEILSRVQRVIDELKALRAAPLVDPFAGPAILDGRAAGVFFHEIFGHRVEGHRQKDEEEGQTFTRKVGERIMPGFLSVFDDPMLARLNGTDLAGHYPFDDEGVRGRRAILVDGGVLRGFLMSRSPVRGFSESNGHGRRARGHRVVSRQGNLVVDPARTTSPAGLKAALLAEARRQGKPYGLRFAEITGGYTNTARTEAQAFKVLPVMVYKVHLDGREELVRGVDLEGTPLSTLSRVVAAANDFSVFNGMCGAESGWVPVSASSASLLVSQIEVARREKGQDRPPLLPAPPLSLRGGKK